ncbi:MAG: type II toxin-antitoxin system RelB/DinJ family antitoxin [Puniceicoccales bacterium]|jgi:addiction module RelB/DinJ family antitoxin|nr:type II toxin-antitoxin system RelB/DinJ family antitoxin [Puniceicoccales bacterium]
MATTLLRTRVDGGNMREARQILASIGLKPSDAVNMLFAKIVAHRGIPFAAQEDGYAYAAREYGASRDDVDATAARVRRNITRAKRDGKLTPINSAADLRS